MCTRGIAHEAKVKIANSKMVKSSTLRKEPIKVTNARKCDDESSLQSLSVATR